MYKASLAHDSRKYIHMHSKCIVGMVDGCGYDGQLEYTICDIHRPYHLILSILKPVLRQLRQISLHLRIDQVPRCQDLVILMVTTTTDRKTDRPITLPLRMRSG